MTNIIYSNGLGTDGGVVPAGGFSFREFVNVTSPSLGYLRLYLLSGAATGLTIQAGSFALQGGATQPNVSALPTQFFFNGGTPSRVFGANELVITDWFPFLCNTGDSVCGIFDAPTAGGNAQIGLTPSGADRLWVAAPAQVSYNQPTVTGFGDNGNVAVFINKIETAGLQSVIGSQWNDSWLRTKISAY